MATENTPPEPLTVLALKAAAPKAQPYEIGDGSGLRVRIEPGGRRVFRWYTRTGGRRVVVTLGEWHERGEGGALTLAAARKRLAELKAARSDGRLEAARRGASPSESATTVKDLANDYAVHLRRQRKSAEEAIRYVERDVLPVLGSLLIEKVTPLDVRRMIDGIVARGALSQADHVLSEVRGLFGFAVARCDLTVNPAAALKRKALGVRTAKRRRKLSETEIREWWLALDRSPMWPSVRAALRLLLLTGVRSGELLRARWTEIDTDRRLWAVPPEHQKLSREQEENAEPWLVPLSDQAFAQLEKLRALGDGSLFVVASPMAKGGVLSRKALGHAFRKLFTGRKPLLRFDEPRPTPHDLRRTLRSGLSALGVPFEVAERSLCHVVGGEVAAIYNRHDYVEERRDALARWGAHVESLVKATSNVPLAAATVRP